MHIGYLKFHLCYSKYH